MSGLDFSNPAFWLALLNALATLALWLRRPGEGAELRVSVVEAELKVLREALTHKSDSDELAKLEGAVSTVAAQMLAMRESVSLTRESIVRIEEFLRANR